MTRSSDKLYEQISRKDILINVAFAKSCSYEYIRQTPNVYRRLTNEEYLIDTYWGDRYIQKYQTHRFRRKKIPIEYIKNHHPKWTTELTQLQTFNVKYIAYNGANSLYRLDNLLRTLVGLRIVKLRSYIHVNLCSLSTRRYISKDDPQFETLYYPDTLYYQNYLYCKGHEPTDEYLDIIMARHATYSEVLKRIFSGFKGFNIYNAINKNTHLTNAQKLKLVTIVSQK